VRNSQKGSARRVEAERAWPEADQLKAMRREQRQLESVPSALRADREEHALLISLAGQCRTNRRRPAWIRDETNALGEQAVEAILYEDFELPMYRDGGQSRVARLLQPFDEERAVTRFRQDAGVEVVPLDALRVC
jgi:hypothetical protein